MRVTIDTNIVVSAMLTPKGVRAQIIQAWEDQQFEPLVSAPILVEYERALNHDEVARRHGMSGQQVAEVVEELRQYAVVVEPQERLEVIAEDPDDNRFLECAVAGGGEYIVSGDPHLLHLKEYRGIQILTPREFLAVLAEEGKS